MRASRDITACPRPTGDPLGTSPGAPRCALSPLRRASFLLFLALLVVLPAVFLVGCGSTTGTSDRTPAQAPAAVEQGAASTGKAAQSTKPAQADQPARIPVITATGTEVIDGNTSAAEATVAPKTVWSSLPGRRRWPRDIYHITYPGRDYIGPVKNNRPLTYSCNEIHLNQGGDHLCSVNLPTLVSSSATYTCIVRLIATGVTKQHG